MEKNVGQMPELYLYNVAANEVYFLEKIISKGTCLALTNGEAVCLAATEISVDNSDMKTLVGAVCGIINDEDGILEILEINVVPDKRRQFIGTTLVAEFIDRVNEYLDYSLEHIVFDFPAEDLISEAFFESLGFKFRELSGATYYDIELEKLLDAHFMSVNTSKKGTTIKSYKELSNVQIKKLISAVNRNRGTFDPFQFATADPNLSTILWDEHHKLKCLVEIKRLDDKTLELGQFYVFNTTHHALTLIREVILKIEKGCPKDTLLRVPIVAGSAERLLKMLFGDCIPSASLKRAYLNLFEGVSIEV